MFSLEQQRQRTVLAGVDGLAVFLAFQLALAIRDPSGQMAARFDSSGLPMLYTGTVLVTIWLVVFHAFDLYRFHKGGMDEVKSVINACATASVLVVLLEFLAHLFVSRLVMASAFALSIWLVLGGRWLTRLLLRWFYTDPKIAIPLVILGFNPFARQLCTRIAEDLSQYELLGFLDDHAPRSAAYGDYPVIGRTAELGAIAEAHPGLELIIATPEAAPGSQEEIIRLCEINRVQWRLVPAPYRSLRNGYRLDMIGGVPLIGPAACNIEGLNYVLKRAFDLLIASAALLLALPLMGLVALLICLIDGRPVLFRQVRIGIRSLPFELLKFRTMHAGTDDRVHRAYVAQWIGHNGHAATAINGRPIYKLVDDPRITPLGRLLRHTALDELPQLFNVLRGEMSLVGPRPALPYELEHYQDWHKRRLDALPGITGLWQVGGRNQVGFDEMVKLDLEYLHSWSLGADLRILLRTVPSVLWADGR
jgi:exopolysaccharide biosynthesis polyprenyl glycosylphosphotransferase